MQNQRTRGIESIFQVGFLIAIFSLLIVLALYFWQFGLNQHSLSRNTKDWAEFGEYVGGTLGGIFGVFAFIGVLINLIYQRTQIDDLHNRARVEDEQRESRFYLDEYRSGYDTAFKILDAAKPTDADFRVKWIAASRVMETARQLSERIKTPSVRDVLLLDLPHQSQRFFRFFELPAETYYGIDPKVASFLAGSDRLDEAARRSSDGEVTGNLRQLPQAAIRTIWAAVQYPKDYEDVVSGVFSEKERDFLPASLKAYIVHVSQWDSINGTLIQKSENR
ncbi:MAG TPA: hypothetical protein VK580_10845 [Steroidobacteraceae bacterium]|nr:hypothetical protein [Steroidobacteraceae bacterium]